MSKLLLIWHLPAVKKLRLLQVNEVSLLQQISPYLLQKASCWCDEDFIEIFRLNYHPVGLQVEKLANTEMSVFFPPSPPLSFAG